MTLIFPDDRSAEARTHALVIGIGGYRHLKGGADEKLEALERILKHVGLLEQLTSPPRSAIGVADWLCDDSTRLRAPLGSLDLLLTKSPADELALPAGVPAGATRAEIEAAYYGWRDRCERNASNVAFFYFCGHGLEKEEQFLLAEDFGANPRNPWSGAFAFDSTRLAFHAAMAKTQCFFVDSCRRLTSQMLTKRFVVSPLEPCDQVPTECEHDLTMKAAAGNKDAMGPPNEPSYFAQALLRAFRGAAARQRDVGWVVETSGIAAHLNDVLRMMGRPGSIPYTGNSRAPLVDVDEPMIPMILGCTPTKANEIAKLSWIPVAGQDLPLTNKGAPWQLETRPGQYRATAEFDDASFQFAKADIIAMPPGDSLNLRC